MSPLPCSASPPKRIYTCTPWSFATNDFFFLRDTGLIRSQLESVGVESRCILALPHRDGDRPDMEDKVIRASLRDMESPEWWRALRLDGLVLYSWGAPRYNRVARAIRRAGIRFAVHLDMCAPAPYWDSGKPLLRRLVGTVREIAVDFLRSRHLRCASAVTASRLVVEQLGKRLFYRGIAGNFRTRPCPVAPHFRYDGSAKNPRIACIGRWDDLEVKRTTYLMETLERLAELRPGMEAEICGRIPEVMQVWHDALPEAARRCIHLRGFTPNGEIPAILNSSQIAVCTSHHEGTCIAMAEALCCGCTLVVSNRPVHLGGVLDYAREPGCGRITREDNPASMAEALAEELDCWAQGGRDARAIAATWQPRVHILPHLRALFDLGESHAR